MLYTPLRMGAVVSGDVDQLISIRRQIIATLRRDIIGPSWIEGTTTPNLEEKLILQGSNPSRRYLGGYLEPSKNIESIKRHTLPIIMASPRLEDNDDTLTRTIENEDERDDSAEPDLMLSTSSMGLTFATQSPSIRVSIEWGEYSSGQENTWTRSHHNWSSEIDTTIGEKIIQPPPAKGIRLTFQSRESGPKKIITLRLVNDREPKKNADGGGIPNSKAMATIYQPKIHVSADTKFVDVRSREQFDQDPTMDILYRNSSILSFGHNVGVDWNDENTEITTEHIPGFEIPKMIPDEELKKYIPSVESFLDWVGVECIP